MKITILTLFPEMFQGPFEHSIIKIAKEKGLLDLQIVNIRDFGLTRHQTVDDTPFGGGIGMVLRVDVLHSALKSVVAKKDATHIILLDARGTTYDQAKAKVFSKVDHLIIICGHYEGVDERIRKYVDEEISIGDYVLTGGEIPSMAIVDSVTRLIPGVLKEGATDNESFSLRDNNDVLLEYPQYTQPREYEGEKVPEVLLSGNHAKINTWRKEKARELTTKNRPDLLDN
jgi:tRNA (guanine37-N1)-methyltransferase